MMDADAEGLEMLEQIEQMSGQVDDLVGLLQRMVRDATRRMGVTSTGQPFVHVPATLLTEAQDLLGRVNPASVRHYRAF